MSAEPAKAQKGKGRSTTPRSLARLAAVQALFQIEFSECDVETVLEEFLEHRFRRPADKADIDFADADKGHFRKVVQGVLADQTLLNDHLRATLPKAWPLMRLDPSVRAILQAAAFEMAETKAPGRAIISEYADLAYAFQGDETRKFAGGALSALAAHIRPEEFPDG